jgi:hypothetical protein
MLGVVRQLTSFALWLLRASAAWAVWNAGAGIDAVFSPRFASGVPRKERLLTITSWSINFGLARVLLSQVSRRNPGQRRRERERDTIPKPSA